MGQLLFRTGQAGGQFSPQVAAQLLPSMALEPPCPRAGELGEGRGNWQTSRE